MGKKAPCRLLLSPDIRSLNFLLREAGCGRWPMIRSSVGIADMKLAKDSGMLVTYALGSCIGICFYDHPHPSGGPAAHHAAAEYGDRTAGAAEIRRYRHPGDFAADGGPGRHPAAASRPRSPAVPRCSKCLAAGDLGNIGQRNIDSVHLGAAHARAFAWWPRMWAAKWPAPCCLTWLPASAASAVMASQN